MSVIESAMLKFFNSTIRAGGSRALTVRRGVTRHARNLENCVNDAVQDSSSDHSGLLHKCNLTGHAREVHLEGYDTHEEVIRAYLEFAGIDPDSKEGRFYFDL